MLQRVMEARDRGRIYGGRTPVRCFTPAALLGILLLASPAAVRAEPMVLADTTPRWVAVQFEISPWDRPGQQRRVFTRPLPARVVPSEEPGHLRVEVSGRIVEQELLAAQAPKQDSFSTFVWIFDSETGHVLSSRVSGTLVKSLDWGPLSVAAEAEVDVEMGTQRPGGYLASKRRFGHEIFRYCAEPGRGGCEGVETAALDPRTGYVNAVGYVDARAGLAQIRSFSPLGEAIFTEISETSPPANLDLPAVSANPPAGEPWTRDGLGPTATRGPQRSSMRVDPR